MANECVPFQFPADSFTCRAQAAVTGKTFVDVTAVETAGITTTSPGVFSAFNADAGLPQIGPCGNGAHGIGVACQDAAVGADVMIFRRGIVPVTVGAGGLTHGQEVQSDGNGNAITLAAGKSLGKALSDAAAGADCPILLSL